MERYLYEMHAHTSDVSPCASVPAQDVIAIYEQAGYTGLVLTDHMSKRVFRQTGAPDESAPWKEKVDFFLRGYRKAKESAGKLQVLLGMEICFYENENDYLVYGLTEEFLYQNHDLLHLGINAFSKLARENGLLLYQAHPFRNKMTVVSPDLLDGIEVHNANPNHDSRNDIALQWANKFSLKMVSGSDFHEYGAHARGGIVLPKIVTTQKELLESLKEGPQLIWSHF